MSQKRESAEARYQRVLELIEVSERVVRDSKLLPDDEKRQYLDDYEANREDARNYADESNASFLRQLEREILTPWKETYDEDSDTFWRLVAERGLGLEREDYLVKILERGRIASFEEYNAVGDSIVVWQQEGRITNEQAKQLSEMLAAFEKRRLPRLGLS
jgi:hypothetical protein